MLPAIIGGVGSLLGGIFGMSAQDRAAAQAKELAAQSVRDLEAIGIPSIEAQRIVLEQYQSAGEYTPELEEAITQGSSAMEGLTTDPKYKEAQLQALSKLQEVGDSGGMTLSDRSTLEKTMGNLNAKARGQREAILQDAQQRGGYGSGTSLAAQLMAQQDQAGAAREAGLSAAASAQQRALQAIQDAGSLGTNLRNQEFGEKADIARAKDQIQQWNAANRQDTQGRNTTTANQAQQLNLQARQNLGNSNVDTRNKQETYNKGLYQQQYENQMQNATAKANARAGQATQATNAGNQTAAMWSGIGSGVNQAANAYGQQQNSNEQRAMDRAAYGASGKFGTMGPGNISNPQIYRSPEDDPYKNLT